MIQYPARNSFDSAKTPSVIGSPSFPARTTLASLGHPKPSVATNTPESLSSLLSSRMNATFRCRSSFDHLAYASKLALVAFIIRMYFMSPPYYCVSSGRFHELVRLGAQFSTSRYDHLRGWLASCRTSMGIFVGAPPGPGTVESRAARA